MRTIVAVLVSMVVRELVRVPMGRSSGACCPDDQPEAEQNDKDPRCRRQPTDYPFWHEELSGCQGDESKEKDAGSMRGCHCQTQACRLAQ
jgi:hypothetical protein